MKEISIQTDVVLKKWRKKKEQIAGYHEPFMDARHTTIFITKNRQKKGLQK